MNILDLYPDLTEETSSIYRVLRSGQPIYNEFQSMRAVKTNQIFNGLNTTIPIKHNNKIIGVAEITRWVEDPFQRKDITVSSKQSQGSASGSNSGISSDDLRLYTIDDIITCSPQMEEIKERIRLISETDSTVLIYGQTGTGKELVAQSIHTSGRRRKNRFVSQNCAAIPDTLLETSCSEPPRAATREQKTVRDFEIANGGTLFLDEINSMEPGMQAKLLKVIEEKSHQNRRFCSCSHRRENSFRRK
ncbi:MAG: sigma 54-interacting transcriptional regulator [Anaerovoracaceae bacterium]